MIRIRLTKIIRLDQSIPRLAPKEHHKDNIMKTFIAVLTLTLAAPVLTLNTASAGHQGEAPHNQKCMGCHKTEVYTREDRKVKTLHALSNQVQNCMKGAANTEWTNKQTGDVVDYLNSKFYKF
jgi:hypothetical protein